VGAGLASYLEFLEARALSEENKAAGVGVEFGGVKLGKPELRSRCSS
jgi:hypothetical protein